MNTDNTLKLFKVTLKGFAALNSNGGASKKILFVLALDPTSAYNTVRDDYTKQDYGYAHDRVLESVELIAEMDQFTGAKYRLMTATSFSM